MYEPIVQYGGDPEAFLRRGGLIIGSERIIPEEGLADTHVVRDGIQIEIHPPPGNSPLVVGRGLQKAFLALREKLYGTNINVVFNGVVDVTQTELNSLSEKSRMWLCQPSQNIYSHAPEERDGATYLRRAAGGHFHFGLSEPIFSNEKNIDERSRLVVPLDIIVGTVCVLLDRDPFQVERRKCYGMAGEYRLPDYGLEYRTPSNFWLRGYPLLNLMIGLSQHVIGLVGESILADNGEEGRLQLEDELTQYAKVRDIWTAINTNDAHLAWDNWFRLRPFLEKHVPIVFGDKDGISRFETFAKGVQDDGIEAYFPHDPVNHWCELPAAPESWYRYSKMF